MKKIYTFLLLLTLTTILSAQSQTCLVSGRIIDRSGQPVPYASVVLSSDSKLLSGTISSDDGSFTIKVPQASEPYKLTVEFIGYRKQILSIDAEGKTSFLSDIVLEESNLSIDDAVVTAKADARKANVEHTTVNASAQMISSMGTALDILSAAPSITVAADAVTIRGSSNILILLDGIPTTVTDLSAIPAADIKGIDVITNPDASHDSEGTGGIINIVSRKISLKGLSGTVSANYGFNHFLAANAAVAYKGDKSSFRFSYNTRYEDDDILGSLDRTMLSTGKQTLQTIRSTRYTFNTNIGIGADFVIDKRNSLSLDLRCILPRMTLIQRLNNKFVFLQEESYEDRWNKVTWNRENAEVAINYRHVIKPKVSSLSVTGSVSKIWGHRPSYYFLGGEETAKSDSGGSPFITSIQADYNHKFTSGTLSSGLKFTYRSNDIYHRFYSIENDNWVYSDVFSNDLLHSELIPAAYIMYSSVIGKKFSYKAGLRGEYSQVRLSSSMERLDMINHDIFISPTLSATYKINSTQDVSFAMSRRVGRPAYPQLNPYMSMVDAVTYEQGNMHLRPEKTFKTDFGYNLKTNRLNIFANAYFIHSKDYISQVTLLDNDKLITTYINGISDMKSGVEFSLNLTPFRWMKASLGSNSFYVDTRGELNGNLMSNNGFSNNSNIQLDFMPGKSTDIQVQYFITTPQYYVQLTSAMTHYMNVGLKQRFFKGALTGSVLLTDVLGTDRWEVTSDNMIFDLKNTSVRKSRMLWVGVTYNFNSFKPKGSQRKQDSDRSLIRL